MAATDLANQVSFVIWRNLALSVDGEANPKAVAADLLAALHSIPLNAPVETP